MPCNSYLQGGLIKNKGGVGLFQISQKERLFHLLWQPGTLGGNLIMRSSFLHPSKKPSSPLQLGQEENIPGHPIERRTYWFIYLLTYWKLPGCSIFPWVKDDEQFLHPSKKPSSPLQLGQEENIPGHPIERRTYWFIYLLTYWKLPGCSIFPWVEDDEQFYNS